jgi:hypothetical protein
MWARNSGLARTVLVFDHFRAGGYFKFAGPVRAQYDFTGLGGQAAPSFHGMGVADNYRGFNRARDLFRYRRVNDDKYTNSANETGKKYMSDHLLGHLPIYISKSPAKY